MQQYFGFPVFPEIEGLKYMATGDGKWVGDNRHPHVLSLGEQEPQQLQWLESQSQGNKLLALLCAT